MPAKVEEKWSQIESLGNTEDRRDAGIGANRGWARPLRD